MLTRPGVLGGRFLYTPDQPPPFPRALPARPRALPATAGGVSTGLKRSKEMVGAASPLGKIMQAAHRLNPCLDLEADIVAVQGGAKISAQADWGGALVGCTADAQGVLTLNRSTTPVSVASNVAGATILHDFSIIATGGHDASGGPFEVAYFDYFLDPNVLPSPLQLNSFAATLGRNFGTGLTGTFNGIWTLDVGIFDELWHYTYLGRQSVPAAGTATQRIPATGTTVFTFDLSKAGYIFTPQMIRSATGAGADNTGALRTLAVDPNTGYSKLTTMRCLRVTLGVAGFNARNACFGCTDNATLANFDPTTFWRAQAAPGLRAQGPYPPDAAQLASPTDLTLQPIGWNPWLLGPAPGYGAQAIANGFFGAGANVPSSNVPWATRGNPTQPWAVPYHNLFVESFVPTGTAVTVVDLGVTPTTDVEFKADYIQPASSSVTFSLRGSNTGPTGPWSAIGAVTDGTILTTPNWYRWYEVTTTLNAPSGATKYATPAVQAIYFLARVKYGTTRYDAGIDATCAIDPVKGDSEIPELKLSLLKATGDRRDLASIIASTYAPSNLEARIYAVNRISGDRLFLNSYRLETHTSSDIDEGFVFLGGLDRLSVQVPAPVESLGDKGNATCTVTAVSVTGSDVQITVSGAPNLLSTTPNVVTGTPNEYGTLASNGLPCNGVQNYQIYVQTTVNPGISGQYFTIINTRASTATSFWITPPSTSAADYPAVGDVLQIHSQWLVRKPQYYGGWDYAAIYADLLINQAQVPARLVGKLPALTGRYAPSGLYAPMLDPAANRTANDVLKEVALHCGGVVAWDQGQIQFESLYDQNGVSLALWDDRHVVSLETPIGADLRMPRIYCGYNYNADPAVKSFANQVRKTDLDAFYGSGLPNLFDVTTLSDTLAAWCDQAEANFLVDMLLKAYSTGVRLWKVTTVLPWPWLSYGDQVTIATDQYADHRSIFSGDGVTDNGAPVAGRVYAQGRIVGKNLWGTDWLVMIPGLSAIATTAQTTGQQGGPYDAITVPADIAYTADVRGDQAGAASAVAVAYTPPPSPYFLRMEYQVATRRTGDTAFGPVSTFVGSKSGVDRIPAAPGSDVQITPTTVTSAGVRTKGTTVIVAVSVFQIPAPTFNTPLLGFAQITYTWTLDATTKYVEVWGRTYATGSQPAAALTWWNASGATKVDTIRPGDGRTEIARPVAAGSEFDAVTFVPFDANNIPGTPISFLSQKAAVDNRPSVPTAASNVSVTGTTVINQVTMPAAITNFDNIRVYRNGVQWGADIPRTAGATLVQQLVHYNVPAGSTNTWQYSGVKASTGDESTVTAAFTPGAGGATTIPTPSITVVLSGANDQFTVTVTPGTGSPAGVTWHLKTSASSGTEVEDTSAASTSISLATTAIVGDLQYQYFKVWGVLSGYTNSADSPEKSCQRHGPY